MSEVWSCVVKMTELFLDTKESKTKKPNDLIDLACQSIYIDKLKKENIKLEAEKNELNKKYQVKTSDPVTNNVIDRIFARHQQGMERFKVTMAQNSKSIPEWIEDTIEENIDAISYMSTLKDRIVEREEKLLKEIDMLRDEVTIANLLNDKKEAQIEKLKLEKVNAVEEAKKEADELMIKKVTMYENKLAKYGKKEEK